MNPTTNRTDPNPTEQTHTKPERTLNTQTHHHQPPTANHRQPPAHTKIHLNTEQTLAALPNPAGQTTIVQLST